MPKLCDYVGVVLSMPRKLLQNKHPEWFKYVPLPSRVLRRGTHGLRGLRNYLQNLPNQRWQLPHVHFLTEQVPDRNLVRMQ
jgi:hypothetical protein